MLLTEETPIDFKAYSELGYIDLQDLHIELYVGDKYIGELEVFGDSLMDDREYVCINYEIVYLDSIRDIELV